MYITKIQDDSFFAKFQLGDKGNQGAGHHGSYPGAEVHMQIDVKFTNLPGNRPKNYSYIMLVITPKCYQ